MSTTGRLFHCLPSSSSDLRQWLVNFASNKLPTKLHCLCSLTSSKLYCMDTCTYLLPLFTVQTYQTKVNTHLLCQLSRIVTSSDNGQNTVLLSYIALLMYVPVGRKQAHHNQAFRSRSEHHLPGRLLTPRLEHQRRRKCALRPHVSSYISKKLEICVAKDKMRLMFLFDERLLQMTPYLLVCTL